MPKTQKKIQTANLEKFNQGWLGAVVVFFLMVVVYTMTMARDHVGFLDSDMFLYMGNKLGTLPSPGYPLYTFLLYLFSLAPIGVNQAVKGHFLSVVFQAGAVSLVFWLLWNLYPKVRKESEKTFVLVNTKTERWLLAGSSALALGFSGLYWRFGLFTERYALIQFLFCLVLFLLARYMFSEGKKNSYELPALSLILGLGASHSWMFWLLVPVLTWVIWSKKVKNWDKIAIQVIPALLIGFAVPFLLLLGYANNKVEYSWLFENDVEGLVEMVGQNYVGDGLARGRLSELLPNIRLDLMVLALKDNLVLLLSSFRWWIVVPLLGSLVYRNSKKETQIFDLFGITAGLVSFGLAFVLDWGANFSTQVEVSPQYLVLAPLIVIFAWFGWQELVDRFGRAAAVLTQKKYVLRVLVAIVVLGALAEFIGNIEDSKLNNKAYGAKFSNQVLEPIQDNSLLICFSYSSCESLIYSLGIKGNEKDIDLVPFYYQPDRLAFDTKSLQGFEYNTFPFLLFDVVTWNVDQRPIYVTDLFKEYYDLFGIEYGFLHYVPENVSGKLQRGFPAQIELSDHQLTESLISYNEPDWDMLTKKVKLEMFDRHSLNAAIYFKAGLRSRGFDEMNLATTMLHSSVKEADRKSVIHQREGVEINKSSQYYVPGENPETVEFVLGEIEKLEEAKSIFRASQVARGAVTLDPRNVDARLKWADLLEQTDASTSAVVEYGNVLKLDPENERALTRLEYQEQLN